MERFRGYTCYAFHPKYPHIVRTMAQEKGFESVVLATQLVDLPPPATNALVFLMHFGANNIKDLERTVQELKEQGYLVYLFLTTSLDGSGYEHILTEVDAYDTQKQLAQK